MTIEVAERVNLGDDLKIAVVVQKKAPGASKPSAVVQLVLQAGSYSSRRPATAVKTISAMIQVPADPQHSNSSQLVISAKEYLPFLKNDYHFEVKAFIDIKETNQRTVLTRDFVFVDPPVTLEYLGNSSSLKVGSKGKVKITFANPLQVKLEKVSLKVDGQGLTKVQNFNVGSVGPKQTISQVVEIEVLEAGNRLLIATVTSEELNSVPGHLELIIS